MNKNQKPTKKAPASPKRRGQPKPPSQQMELVWVPVDGLIPYANNPRINDHAVDAVAGSIKAFGWKQPIVVDREMVIIAGHTRYKAAKKLGLTQVPVLIARDLTDAQAKAYRLADNRAGENAKWDFPAMKIEIAQLSEMGGGFRMQDFGFTEQELAPSDSSETTQADMTERASRFGTTIRYEIVFDDLDQQTAWYGFLRWLKRKDRKDRTIGALLADYINEHKLVVE